MLKKIVAPLIFMVVTATLAEDTTPKTWSDRITLQGDVRLRGEYINKDDDSDRWRGRFRARARLNAQVIDNLRAGIGLRTGGDEPAGAHQTFGDAFSSKDFMVDLAFLTWSPSELDAFSVTGGKMNKPWIMISEMIWDANVNPEGLAAVFTPKFDNIQLLLNAGAFLVQERHNAKHMLLEEEALASTSQDTWLYAGQAGVRSTLFTNLSFLASGSYYHYDHLSGMATLYDTGKGFGNTTTASADSNMRFYRYDYRIVEALGEITTVCPFTGLKIRLHGQYVRNTEPDTDREGFLTGLKIGELKKPGTFCLGYSYRELQKDAALGVFADSPIWGGGTDGRGHKIEAGYQLTRNLSLAANWFITESTISSDATSYQRVQLDLTATF